MPAERRLAPTPRRHRGPAELEGARQVRVRVFCEEQGVDRETELDDRDTEAIHLVAMERGKVIATCRLRPEGGEGGSCKLERMAIDKDFRGIGLGRRLIEVSETEARREGAAEMLLHSQLPVRGFYERSGYEVTSEEVFLEDGLEHVRMRRAL
ncbi:MAG: GNAT family N-acetyltransferase [Solirubrobacterales bacterium]